MTPLPLNSRTLISVKMKLRFNPIERMAGAFILFAVIGTMISGGAVLVRKGFFEKKLPFKTLIPSNESIYTGMPVMMSGVRVGKVDEIELDSVGGAEVFFSVRSKYVDRVRADSRVSISRQSLLGEKIFDLSAGTRDAGSAVAGQLIELRQSGDVMGAITGARVGLLTDNMTRLLGELAEVASHLTRKKNTEVLMGNMRETSESLRDMTKSFPQVGRDVAAITSQFAMLGEELAKKSPDGNTRVAQILEETSVLIRALQRNFLIRTSVRDVREEEQKRVAEQKQREALPAGEDKSNERKPANTL